MNSNKNNKASCGLCSFHKLNDTCNWGKLSVRDSVQDERVYCDEQTPMTRCGRWYNNRAVDVLGNGLLWLAPFASFGDSVTWLSQHHVKHVLCLYLGSRPSASCLAIASYSFKFSIDDTDTAKLPIEGTAQWIHERVDKKEPVLVTCLAGINRSVSIVLAYLITKQKMTLDAASNRIARLPINRNFLGQLQQLYTLQSSTI